MTAAITTTLGQLADYYGVSLGDDASLACYADTPVTLWRGEDGTIHEGWHINADGMILPDEKWAPRDDEQAAGIRAALA